MTKWKLTRELYGTEEYSFKENDEVTIGRACDNTLSFSSLVISRKHCIIRFLSDKAVVTDAGSSNGVYVGTTKIPQNSSYDVKNSEIIGLGWTLGASIVAKLEDAQKYMFKLSIVGDIPIEKNAQSQENENTPNHNEDRVVESQNNQDNIATFENRKLQSSEENQNEIEDKIAAFENGKQIPKKEVSSTSNGKLSLKRKSELVKSDEIKQEIKQEKRCRIITMDDDVILLSDSDHETKTNQVNCLAKKVNSTPVSEDNHENTLKDQIKCENKHLEFEAFNIKQEYVGYDDEPIKIESDSDSESEHWYLRLSQNSPGKPFSKISKTKTEEKADDNSYSQMDDDFVLDLSYTDDEIEEVFMDDIITIPESQAEREKQMSDIEEYPDDIISLHGAEPNKSPELNNHQSSKDQIDGHGVQMLNQIPTNKESPKAVISNDIKKTQMIEPLVHTHKTRAKQTESKPPKSTSRHSKIKKHSSKKHISNSQKEERKKKLKEIATKERECDQSANTSISSNSKSTLNVKITNSNRGAFLTNSIEVVKISKKKDKQRVDKSKKKTDDPLPHKDSKVGDIQSPEDMVNNKKRLSHSKSSKRQEHKPSKSKKELECSKSAPEKPIAPESRVPLVGLKPLTVNNPILPDIITSGTPIKLKKKVRFSETGPQVHFFEIEPGNKMKKTSSVKNSLVDIRHMPVFSLEKITLMKILRWNPKWLEEQLKLNDRPPILGHNNLPMSTFHSYTNHHQYVQMVGDLLLLEIWEYLTLAYMKIREQNSYLEMRIGSLPPIPTQERSYELFSISVNLSLPSQEVKKVPRLGEILQVTFGAEKVERFFYVHNVRCLPSPPNNIHSFYSIGLHATYTDKMSVLRLGEVIKCRSLAYISKELNLFEAMEYLASSPLSEAILHPEPKHFEPLVAPPNSTSSKWTKTLNPSQQAAVASSVAAALGDKPCIQMVQGPPGTGKSSVICSIVMTYFYNEQERRRQNRGKIMICATSNAAVDELVIRLLNIRQSLPKSERFRMVRVGRAEAMAARARDVSSQHLAQRDARAHAAEPAPRTALHEEIAHLEAKINMWKTQAQDAKDPVRVAYCQGRVNDLVKRITLVRAGGGCAGEELRPDQLVAAERRIIEGADIIVTTLASAYNHKMRGLRRRIALCVIDEAGQAIEPETLLPLTLDVTRLTLIGDPQQLPGYICSQDAKKHGLGESLFARLTSNSEQWSASPVALLDVQYRMHGDIADYPNRAFYGGRVRSAGPPRPPLPRALAPYLLLTIASGDKGQGVGGGNEMEACGVARLVSALNSMLRPLALSLAVITPYHAQKDLIKKYLRSLQDPSESAVEVNTVDSFQGQERDVVVVSLARTHGVGFLTDAGRMNVMLTRARHALIVCLNPQALLRNDQWRTLIEDARRRKMYKTLPNSMCQPITAGQSGNGDILKYVISKK